MYQRFCYPLRGRQKYSQKTNCIRVSFSYIIHIIYTFLFKEENPTRRESISNNFQRKSFHEVVVEKVLCQRNLNRNNKKVKSKRKFRKISKRILLLKMFSRENKTDVEEEDSLCDESSSLSYHSCCTSQSLSFYSARSPRDSLLTSCNVQTNPDILIDPVEDCGDQTAKLDVDLYSVLNPPIEENLLSAGYQGKNIVNYKEDNSVDNQDLFSTKYKKDKKEECSINVSFYHQVLLMPGLWIKLSPSKVFKPIRNFRNIKEFSVQRLMGKLYIFI